MIFLGGSILWSLGLLLGLGGVLRVLCLGVFGTFFIGLAGVFFVLSFQGNNCRCFIGITRIEIIQIKRVNNNPYNLIITKKFTTK